MIFAYMVPQSGAVFVLFTTHWTGNRLALNMDINIMLLSCTKPITLFIDDFVAQITLVLQFLNIGKG